MVDHLAAASDSKQAYSNVSIECPSKPSDYTCPRVLSLNKEELKKKLCDYETIMSGSLNLIPDTEKSQTRCGGMKIDKVSVKNDEDNVDLVKQMAVVIGKDCQLKSLFENNSTTTNKNAAHQEEQFHMLVKTPIPSSTKLILADGANMDLLWASAISKDEIASILKQCPKVSS